jgi:8-oxo-dGTP pyrophosphatase MutT (NUDIX family)
MNFDHFLNDLRARLQRPLPGHSAHDLLKAEPIGHWRPKLDHSTPPRPGAVLILLYPEAGIVKFPLIRRATYAGTHSGQISWPGGKAEAGETIIETALREAEEEIGVDRHQAEVLGTLTELFVIASNFTVTPVVAAMHGPIVFRPDPRETAGIIYGDLFDLLREEAVLKKEILAGGQYRMMAPHFEVEGEVVWGATAMMLNELRVILKDVSRD